MPRTVEVNRRRYLAPAQPTAVVCLDGVDPAYLVDGLERGLLPRVGELALHEGRSQLPSFTNPNNVSIVTGVAPAAHGISGNHYLDVNGDEVQLVDAALLRARTIHACAIESGTTALCVTTKDKLRGLLGAEGVPCVSAEGADRQTLAGVSGPIAELLASPPPGIYDWNCSHYALELGLVLADRLEIELLYVSLTDFVQHAAAPGEELSDRYLALLDGLVGRYLDAGWRLGLVADHGMNAKPSVVFLGDLLDDAELAEAQVVLPITDPYVVHHAALGAACWIYSPGDLLERVADTVAGVDGVEEVLTRYEAAHRLDLPPDRIGDLVVLADQRTALGKRQADHDLSQLHGTLRSHGGRHEQAVPILLSELPPTQLEAPWSNADIHMLVLGEAM
jgi:phosphonoacetate hydrolase